MSQANALEQLMLDLINAERAAAGVDPVTFDSDLNTSAEDHSTWMLEEDQFSHQGAGGSSPTARMQDAGFEFEGAWRSGENIGWQSERGAPGLEDDVEQIHESLMNSPGHRANILNPDFDEIGIGIERGDFTDEEGRTFDAAMVTQNFATTDAVDDNDDDTVGPVAQSDTDTDDTPVDDDSAEPVAEETPQDPTSDGPADVVDPEDENETPVDVAETDDPTGDAEEEPVDTTDRGADTVETPAEDPADDPVETADTEVPEVDDAPVEEVVACELGNGGLLFIDFGELPLDFDTPDTEADNPVEAMAPSGSEVSDMDGESANAEFDVDAFLTEISDMLMQIDFDVDSYGCSEMA